MKLIVNATYFMVGSVMFWLAPHTNCPSAFVFIGILSLLGILFNTRRFWRWYLRKFTR